MGVGAARANRVFDRTFLVSLLALAAAVVALVVTLTRGEHPTVTRYEHLYFPPPLNNVNLGETPAQVQHQMGRPVAVHRFASQLCWDYVFPTATPRYRLCFLDGRLALRTPF